MKSILASLFAFQILAEAPTASVKLWRRGRTQAPTMLKLMPRNNFLGYSKTMHGQRQYFYFSQGRLSFEMRHMENNLQVKFIRE